MLLQWESTKDETDVKYFGNKAVIMPLDVPIDCTFEQLGDMIYSRTTIDKQRFKLVLNCKNPLKSGNRFQPFPIWNDNSVYRMLDMVNTTSMEEIKLYIEVVQVKPQVNQYMGDYTDLLVHKIIMLQNLTIVVGPISGPALDTNRCGVYANDEDCEYDEDNVESNEDVDDESNGDLDVQDDGHVSYFQTFNQVLENEQGIYVSMHSPSCDVSNNPDAKEPDESSPVHYHLPLSP